MVNHAIIIYWKQMKGIFSGNNANAIWGNGGGCLEQKAFNFIDHALVLEILRVGVKFRLSSGIFKKIWEWLSSIYFIYFSIGNFDLKIFHSSIFFRWTEWVLEAQAPRLLQVSFLLLSLIQYAKNTQFFSNDLRLYSVAAIFNMKEEKPYSFLSFIFYC